MRGVSEFVLVLLILIVAVISVSIVWLVFFGHFREITFSADTTSVGEILSSCMKIDSVRNNKIYLKNCGSGVIKNNTLKVYFDEEEFEYFMTPKSIAKGEIGTITLTNLNLFLKGAGKNYKLEITSPSTSVQRYVKAVLPSSCVLYFNFDEGTGTIAHDSCGNNDGTLHNGDEICFNGDCPTWVDGKFGKALDFDGAEDFVNATDIPNTDLTILAWIYPKQFVDGDESAIVSKWKFPLWDIDYEWMWRIAYDTSKTPTTQWEFWTSNGGDQKLKWAKSPVQLNQWSYVAIVYDRENMKVNFYSNNEIIQSNPDIVNVGKTPDTNQPVRVGAQGGGTFDWFNGIIDEVRIYNETLTPDNALTLTLIELT
jgi:hypothetical protein